MVGTAFSVLIIGDEILSGKRKDGHFAKAVELLNARGCHVAQARYLPDDLAVLTDVLRASFQSGSPVLCMGGIGATPDDYTRQAAAQALGVSLQRHPEGVAILERKFAEEAYPHRIKMVEFPEGASLIPNPFNEIPGFSIQQHYFLPGFPQMAWPMIDWVLETQFSQLGTEKVHEIALLAQEALEGVLIPLMEDVVKQFPALKLFSLPRFKEKGGRELELGVRGVVLDDVKAAIALLQQGLTANGYQWVVKGA